MCTLLLSGFLSGACMPPVQITPPLADAPAAEVALSGASIMIGAGDIGVCDGTGDDSTAKVIDSVLKADSVAKVEDVVFTLGDHAYPSGTQAQFDLCWGRSWGDSTKRLMKSIRPSLGNHEYESDGAAPYFRYFGSRAGDPKKGYYAYSTGAWRVIVLNSELPENPRFTLAQRKAQEDWLLAELKDNAKPCTVAYYHRPRFSSGTHGGQVNSATLFRILYEGGVDLALAGHDHHYERFFPMAPSGVLDTLKGITQLIVGTGGAELRGIRATPALHSAYRIQGRYGVLKLTLGSGAWRSAFLDARGRPWDLSGGTCH